MNFTNLEKDITLLKGESIDEVYIIKAEYGRTIDNYLGVTTKSGKRFLCGVINRFHDPSPTFETMKDCPFFSVEEVQERARLDAEKSRQAKKRREKEEREKYERLKAKYEVGGKNG